MPIPQQAVDLIKKWEGCRLKSYKDIGGVWTIGYGHTYKVEAGQSITETDAERFLIKDLYSAYMSIRRLITRPLNDNQLSALLSFTYNLGAGRLQHSTLRQKCNREEDSEVPKEFLKWCHSNGLVVKGLYNRRLDESILYATPISGDRDDVSDIPVAEQSPHISTSLYQRALQLFQRLHIPS